MSYCKYRIEFDSVSIHSPKADAVLDEYFTKYPRPSDDTSLEFDAWYQYFLWALHDSVVAADTGVNLTPHYYTGVYLMATGESVI